MSIIKSVLDTDLYKFTTSYAYSKLFPRAFGEFEFVDRSNGDYPEGFDKLLLAELKSMEKKLLLSTNTKHRKKNGRIFHTNISLQKC